MPGMHDPFRDPYLAALSAGNPYLKAGDHHHLAMEREMQMRAMAAAANPLAGSLLDPMHAAAAAAAAYPPASMAGGFFPPPVPGAPPGAAPSPYAGLAGKLPPSSLYPGGFPPPGLPGMPPGLPHHMNGHTPRSKPS